jgi:hypothetical protein
MVTSMFNARTFRLLTVVIFTWWSNDQFFQLCAAKYLLPRYLMRLYSLNYLKLSRCDINFPRSSNWFPLVPTYLGRYQASSTTPLLDSLQLPASVYVFVFTPTLQLMNESCSDLYLVGFIDNHFNAKSKVGKSSFKKCNTSTNAEYRSQMLSPRHIMSTYCEHLNRGT